MPEADSATRLTRPVTVTGSVSLLSITRFRPEAEVICHPSPAATISPRIHPPRIQISGLLILI